MSSDFHCYKIHRWTRYFLVSLSRAEVLKKSNFGMHIIIRLVIVGKSQGYEDFSELFLNNFSVLR